MQTKLRSGLLQLPTFILLFSFSAILLLLYCLSAYFHYNTMTVCYINITTMDNSNTWSVNHDQGSPIIIC